MNFGSFVSTREGEVLGTLERLLLDIATNQVNAYVVSVTEGPARAVIVPNSAVYDINDGLTLNLNLATAKELPGYAKAGSTGVSATGRGRAKIIELSIQTKVECSDGDIGTLVGVVVDEMTTEVTDVVVQLKDGRSVPVPVAWAASLQGDRIRFQCARSEI